ASFHGPGGIALERSAEFFQWRFFDKPTHEYAAWGSHHDGELQAYVVTREARLFGSRCLLLMDVGHRPGGEAALVSLIADRMWTARAEGIEVAATLGLHPSFGRLTRLGFLPVSERVNPRPFRLVVRPVTAG